MAVKPSLTVLAISVAIVYLISPLNAQDQSFDVKTEARAVVATARQIVMRAKEGSPLDTILQNILDLENVTSNVIAQLTKNISECETQSVIKMAAAAVGSHEVLGVMLAEGTVNVLSTRLGLALAFISHVTQQLDDKLALSTDVGSELTAIIFATNTTANIINSADQKIKEKVSAADQVSRSKRGAAVSFGRGFDVTNHVISWKDTTGRHTIYVNPGWPVWFPRGHHLYARSPSGWTGSLGALGDLHAGSAQGNLAWQSKSGRWNFGLGGGLTWGPGGLQPAAGLSLTFKF